MNVCDAATCAGCRYSEERDGEPAACLAEFLADCQQAKCKVVRLVRQQISKLQSTQYGESGMPAASGDESGETRDGTETFAWKPHETAFKVNVKSEVLEVADDIGESADDDEPDEVTGETEQTHNTWTDEETFTGPRQAVAEEIKVEATDAVRKEVAVAEAPSSPASGAGPLDRELMLRVLNCVRHRAHLILAAATLGVIAWTALVYGVFLGATACGSGGRYSGCSAYYSPLRYAHSPPRRSLF